jgi:hypothetical protein
VFFFANVSAFDESLNRKLTIIFSMRKEIVLEAGKKKTTDEIFIKLSILAVPTGFNPALCRKKARLMVLKAHIQSLAAIST